MAKKPNHRRGAAPKDFFVSYSRRLGYFPEAHQLKHILETRNYSVWIDSEHMVSKEMTQSGLACHLADALRSCRYVVFFETAAQLAAQVGGDPVRVWSWQEFELDLVDRVIFLYHRQLSVAFGKSSKLHRYETLDEAADLVEAGIRDVTLFQ